MSATKSLSLRETADVTRQVSAPPAETYSYDANGNLISKTDATGTTTYVWDVENRLTSVTLPAGGGSVTYQYDPFGRRIEKVSPTGTTIYAYDGNNVVEELDGGGTAVARYAQGLGIDEPLAMYRGGLSYYYNADGLGSITSLTDTSGQIAASYTYDSFGKLTASTGTVTNPFRYTGREYGTDTGLYYYRARYYDSNAGRFISEDPIRFDADVNFYRYAKENPVNYKDPSGLRWIYCQNTGDLYYEDNTTGARQYEGTGYSGEGVGKNNQGMEYAFKMGPIVQGDYTIGPQEDITVHPVGRRPYKLYNAMRLTPTPETNNYIHSLGRTGGFIMHGDSIQRPGHASQGCPVLDKTIRERVAESPDKDLSVELCGNTD